MADTALRHPVLELRRMAGGGRLLLDPALELGVGGEARVLGLPGDPTRVAKLYHRADLERARKLSLMIGRPPVLAPGAALAWPQELVADVHGRFAGFLMPRAEGPRVFELYNPVARRRIVPLFDWERLHGVGINLASAFAGLHASGYVIGDVNESNFVVSPAEGSVTLVDTDSFQVREPHGLAYRSGVGKAEFTPPELQGARFDQLDRTPAHDAFGLGVLLYLLLMEGTHPFAVRLGEDPAAGRGRLGSRAVAEPLSVEERLRRGYFPWAPGVPLGPPRLAPSFELLDPALQGLFLRCFAAGHRDPAARPPAEEWRGALESARASLQSCPENPRHRFSGHLGHCPWCHRRALLRGRDPFPASVALARQADALPPRATPPVPVAARMTATAGPVSAPSGAAAQWGAPGPLTSPLVAFVQGVQAGLPAWVAGDDALGSPVPWMLPAVLTVLAGSSGQLRVAGMMVLFFALRRIFRAGFGPVRAITAVWAVLLVLCWLSFASLIGAVSGAAPVHHVLTPGSLSQLSTPPGVPAPQPLIPQPERSLQGEPVLQLAEVDVPPRLIDASAASEMIARLGPPLPGQVRQSATVSIVVNSYGEAELPTLVSSTSSSFALTALSAARRLRYEPARRSGTPVAVRLEVRLAQTD